MTPSSGLQDPSLDRPIPWQVTGCVIYFAQDSGALVTTVTKNGDIYD